MGSVEIRYSLFWIALEALFGPKDGRELVFRLSQRIAFFLAKSRSGARETASIAKKAYDFRSKLVHGNWQPNAKAEDLMGDTENIARSCLVRMTESETLLDAFMKDSRESFLDNLVFTEEQTE